MTGDETFPPSSFVVRRWVDPVVEQCGFPVNSVYTETTRSKQIFEPSESSPSPPSDGGGRAVDGGGRGVDESFPPSRFLVRRWADPVVEARGFRVNSIYTETVMLPILGPSTTFCLRRLSAWAAVDPAGKMVDTKQLARDLGLGDGIGRNSPMARTLDRLCRFGLGEWHDKELSVRTVVAPLSGRQLARLSPELVQVHDLMVRRQLQGRPTHMGSSTALHVDRSPELGLGR